MTKKRKEFYVYVLRVTTDKTLPCNGVFYVGKGTGKRVNRHRRVAKRGSISSEYCPVHEAIEELWCVGDEFTEDIIFRSGSEIDCFVLEKYLIKQFGRIDLATGILYNKTPGGDGKSYLRLNYEFIYAHILNWMKSGLSGVEYCRRNDLPPESIKSWNCNTVVRELLREDDIKPKLRKIDSELAFDHIVKWIESGIMMTEYCKNAGIVYVTFKNWKTSPSVVKLLEKRNVKLPSSRTDDIWRDQERRRKRLNSMRYISIEDTAMHLLAQQKSGLTQKDYCKKQGIALDTITKAKRSLDVLCEIKRVGGGVKPVPKYELKVTVDSKKTFHVTKWKKSGLNKKQYSDSVNLNYSTLKKWTLNKHVLETIQP